MKKITKLKTSYNKVQTNKLNTSKGDNNKIKRRSPTPSQNKKI